MPHRATRRTLHSIAAQAAAGTWSPLDLASLVAWYDFSDADTLFTDAGTTKVTTDGDLIYQANDKSGNGLHLTQTTETARPAYKVNVFNGLAAVLFDAVDDVLKQSSAMNPRTGFIVARAASGLDNNAGLFTGIDNSTNRTGPFIRSGPNYYWLTSVENTYYERVRTNGTLNNNLVLDTLVIYSGYAIVDMIKIRQFGNDRGLSGRYWKDYICEAVFCTTELSTAEYNVVGNYLATKWGLTWTDVS